jgi:membrane protease YdiL (CAAX protease family)
VPVIQLPSDHLPPVAQPEGAHPSWLRPELVAPWKEIAAMIALFVGPFAIRSSLASFQESGPDYINRILSDSGLLTSGTVEAILLTAFLSFLHWRKWIRADFKIITTRWTTWESVLLVLLMFAANTVVVVAGFSLAFALQSKHPHLAAFVEANNPHFAPHSVHFNWPLLIGVMILNAFYEELTCIGYVFNQFAAKHGAAFAVTLIVLLRMSCHSYQGVIHMLGIGAAFTVSGLWYARTRNLWPLIFGHALLDISSSGIMRVLFG